MSKKLQQLYNTEFFLVVKAHLGEYFNKPLLNIGFVLSLAIATSVLLSILVLNDASKQQYQTANSRLKSPIAFYIVPKSGKSVFIHDYVKLKSHGFHQINGVNTFRKTLENGESISFRAMDTLPLVLTAKESYSSKKINISQKYAKKLSITLEGGKTSTLSIDNHTSIALHVNQVNDWGNFAIIDIALAWQLFPDIEHFSHLAVGTLSISEKEKLLTVLPSHLMLQETFSIEEREGFADALHLNLSALAVLGFIVSLFIAYQAANQAWSKRRELAAQLRLLGVELSTILKVMLCEAMLLTLVASLIGIGIGFFLVSMILPLLGITLDQLYRLQLSGHFQWQLQYSIWAFLISAVAVITALFKQFGLIGTAHIAFSARMAPQPFNFITTFILALFLLLLFFIWPDKSWTQIMIKYGLLLVASVALLPNILKLTLKLLSRLITTFKLKYIFQDAGAQVGRRYLPVAAFYLALTSSIAAALMVNSFQTAFVSYLNQLLSADLFVSYQKEQKQDLETWLSKHDGVEEFALFQSTTAKYKNDTIVVHRLASERQQNSLLLKYGQSVALNSQEKACYINEQFAYQHNIKLQQILTIKQLNLSFSCRVNAVFYDYGNQSLSIKIPAINVISKLSGWEDSGFGLYLNAPTAMIKQSLVSDLALDKKQMYEPNEIRTLALAMFEQTFVLTQAIAFVLLSIACFGLFLSANSLELARKPDLHILSSLGYSQVELFIHMLAQWFVLALGTILLSWPIAAILANALVSLVLPASFGWSMPLVFDLGSFTASSLIGLLILIPALSIPLYKLNTRANLS